MAYFKRAEFWHRTGFQSTSIDPHQASSFVSHEVRPLLEIIPKKGAWIRKLTGGLYRTEMEFLLPNGMKYRFVGRKKVKVSLRRLGTQEREVLQFEMIDPDEVP